VIDLEYHFLGLKSPTFEPRNYYYYYYGCTVLCWALAAFSVSWSYTQWVGLLRRGLSPWQGRHLRTEQHKHRINAHTADIHALSGIRTHGPSVWMSAATLIGRISKLHMPKSRAFTTQQYRIQNTKFIDVRTEWQINIKRHMNSVPRSVYAEVGAERLISKPSPYLWMLGFTLIIIIIIIIICGVGLSP
jgi:hypothetical protein